MLHVDFRHDNVWQENVLASVIRKDFVPLHQGFVPVAEAAIALLLLSVAVFNFIGFDNALAYSSPLRPSGSLGLRNY